MALVGFVAAENFHQEAPNKEVVKDLFYNQNYDSYYPYQDYSSFRPFYNRNYYPYSYGSNFYPSKDQYYGPY
ncbi:hypothetical protein GN156_27125, partial [bacterium LRH843]|nr:hypothetical protein [bacterium LRH843]